MSQLYTFHKITDTCFYVEGPGIDSSSSIFQFNTCIQAANITHALNEAYCKGRKQIQSDMRNLLGVGSK